MSVGPLSRMLGLDDNAAAALIARLASAHITVATAESLTGGLLAALLTEVPGASAVVRGGIVVYATELKASLAGVDSTLLAERGPVDPDVAVGLADGARSACGADVGVGLTGVAGPDPQNGVAVGTVYVAITGLGSARAIALGQTDLSAPRPGISRRDDIRFAAVRAAMDLLGQVG